MFKHSLPTSVLQLVNFNFVHQLCSVWIIALKLKYLDKCLHSTLYM